MSSFGTKYEEREREGKKDRHVVCLLVFMYALGSYCFIGFPSCNVRTCSHIHGVDIDDRGGGGGSDMVSDMSTWDCRTLETMLVSS